MTNKKSLMMLTVFLVFTSTPILLSFGASAEDFKAVLTKFAEDSEYVQKHVNFAIPTREFYYVYGGLAKGDADKAIQIFNDPNYPESVYGKSKIYDSEETTLKEQLIDYKFGEKLICPNPDHVIVLRPNTQWACVFSETAQYLKWDIVSFSDFGIQKTTTHVLAHDTYHKVSYQISSAYVDSIKYNLDFHSLEVKITPTDKGELSLDIPTGDNGLFLDFCHEIKSEYPPVIMVIRDGEEVEHESSEINTNLLNVKTDYFSNTELIRIIYVCLT